MMKSLYGEKCHVFQRDSRNKTNFLELNMEDPKLSLNIQPTWFTVLWKSKNVTFITEVRLTFNESIFDQKETVGM